MSLAIFFEEVARVVFTYAPQILKSPGKKYYEDLSREWTIYQSSELITGMKIISGHVGKTLMDFLGFIRDLALLRQIENVGCH